MLFAAGAAKAVEKDSEKSADKTSDKPADKVADKPAEKEKEKVPEPSFADLDNPARVLRSQVCHSNSVTFLGS